MLQSDMDDEFEHYDNKIAELNDLLLNAKSTTLKDLLSKAIKLTEASLGTLVQTKAVTVKYLTEHENNTAQKLFNYKLQLDLLEQRKSLLDTVPNDVPVKASLVSQFDIDVNTFQKQTSLDAELHEKTHEVFGKCHSEIERTLLEFIVKPATGEFKYDVAKNMISYIISKLQILGLDEINLLSQSSIMSQKIQSINSGDKILIYIEQYIDVLERWDLLCKNYIKIVEE